MNCSSANIRNSASVSVSAHLWGLRSFPADRHQHVVVLVRARGCRGGTACHGNPFSILLILSRGTVKLVIPPANHWCLKHTQRHAPFMLRDFMSALFFSCHNLVALGPRLFISARFNNSEPAGQSGCLFSIVLLLRVWSFGKENYNKACGNVRIFLYWIHLLLTPFCWDGIKLVLSSLSNLSFFYCLAHLLEAKCVPEVFDRGQSSLL